MTTATEERIFTIQDYRDLEPLLKKANNQKFQSFYPKIYDNLPSGYMTPKQVAINMHIRDRGHELQKQDTTYRLTEHERIIAGMEHYTVEQCVAYKMPIFWVDKDISESLLNTTLSEDLSLSDIKWPLPSLCFMLPEGLLTDQDGYSIKFITLCHNETYKVAICMMWIDGQHAAVFNFVTDKRLSHFKPQESDPINDHFKKVLHLALQLLMVMVARPEMVCAEKKETYHSGHPSGKKFFYHPRWVGKGYKVARESFPSGETHKSPVFHWRVGHFRNQHYGEKNSLLKLIWIEPVMVNGPRPLEKAG